MVRQTSNYTQDKCLRRRSRGLNSESNLDQEVRNDLSEEGVFDTDRKLRTTLTWCRGGSRKKIC